MNRAVYLYRLQQLDSEEEQVRGRLAEIESALGEVAALRQAQQTAQKTAGETRHWSVRQQDLELQASTFKQKIADSERKLYNGSIRNPKELSERQAKLASLGRRLERTEEELLEAMIAREEAEAATEQARERLEAVEKEWAASQQDLLTEKEQMETRRGEIGATRTGLLPSISATDLKIYHNLRRTKGGMAVVLLRGETCTGCWMEIPSGQLEQGRQEGLLFCDNCERILLLEEYL